MAAAVSNGKEVSAAGYAAAAASAAGGGMEDRLSGQHGASPAASQGDDRQISCEDIQRVQNLIEKCLELYMTQDEVVNTLKSEASIQPRFTTLVWQKLEEQNPEFFRAYYTRLKLKDQIILFNHLLEQQVQMFQKIQSGWVQPAGPQVVAQPPMSGQPVATMPMMPMALPTGLPPRAPMTIQATVGQPAQGLPSSMPPRATRVAIDKSATAALPVSSAVMSTQSKSVPSQAHVLVSAVGHIPSVPPAVPQVAHNVPVATAAAPAPNSRHSTLADISTSLPPAADHDFQATAGLAVSALCKPDDSLVGNSEIEDSEGLPRNFSMSDLNLDPNLDGSLGLLHAIGGDGLDLAMDLET